MNEKLNARLGNPMEMFFWSFAALLLGIVIGEYLHPSRMRAVTIAAAAGAGTNGDMGPNVFCAKPSTGVTVTPVVQGTVNVVLVRRGKLRATDQRGQRARF